jgi:hypothetical protein
MPPQPITQIADLISKRNTIDEQIAGIIQRPMTAGHLGEWLAAEIFDVLLERSAVNPGCDGHFRTGPLQGRTVDIKWYLKREGLLDMTGSPDNYLVFAGPISPAASSRGTVRPWCISSVYLFDGEELRDELTARGVKIGVATSVRGHQWTAAEIYPSATNRMLTVTPDQAAMLDLFRPT